MNTTSTFSGIDLHKLMKMTRRFAHHAISLLLLPQRLVAASALRVGLGTLVFVFFALHVSQVQLLWGPNSIQDYELYARIRGSQALLFGLAHSASATWVWYGVALLLSALFALGIWTRIVTPLLAYAVLSFFLRDEYVLDGGHDALILTLFYLIFVKLDTHFTLLPRSQKWLTEASRSRSWFPIIVHNVAVFFVMAQMATVYFTAGLEKISGHKWQDGTALYYILRTDVFSLPGVSNLVYEHGVFVTLISYGTILFELSFAFLLWRRAWRPTVYFAAVGMHIGIAVLMGLTYFAITMLVLDLIIFDDVDFRKCRQFVQALARIRVRSALQPMAGTRSGRP